MPRILILSALITLLAAACATSQPQTEPPAEEIPVAQPAPAPPEPLPVAVAPPPAAAPAPEPVAEPVAAPPLVLPETASQLPLVGLAGLASIGLGGVVRTLRRWFL
jgi:hypothetical protein